VQAIDALADLRERGLFAQLVIRGGKEPYGQSVFARARELGLTIDDVVLDAPSVESLAQALSSARADVVNVRSFLPDALLYALYGAVDAVLANSGKEPFGLVGLEVMASGGIAVCGSTGEDYARSLGNALVCDTAESAELASYLERLWDDPALRERIRESARATAESFTWPPVLEVLNTKVAFVSRRR
jgi:glycosyltransferase involved in cell wall biosynthesis